MRETLMLLLRRYREAEANRPHTACECGAGFFGRRWDARGCGTGPTLGLVPAAGPFRQPYDGWYQDNVTASQTAVILARKTGASAFATKAIFPRAGSVTAVWVKSNAARSAGTLTVEVYKNTSAIGLTAVLNGTDTTFKTTTQARGVDTFVAGDELDIRITTDGSWAPTTADIETGLEVET